jgi:hypothetical protein
MTANSNALLWPALAADAGDLPSAISCERGIWGKVHTSPADFHWIATTPGFSGPSRHFEHELPLGAEDAPVRATLWRVIGDLCHSVALVPSGAHDASGRTGFVEKHILEWRRPPNVPAAAGALLLLPAVAQFRAIDWSEPREEVRWSDDDIDALDPIPPLPLSIDAALAEGLRALTHATTEDALAQFYTSLLAGNRAVTLAGTTEPPPPEALAALLLPLPREIADTLSIAGWLPSTRVADGDEVRRCWNAVIGGTTSVPAAVVPPSTEQIAEGLAMAQSIFTNRPPQGTSSSGSRPVRLALWGPSAAGKTALLAKLFLDANDEHWDVFPTEQSLEFIKNMRWRMKASNQFPTATRAGEPQSIEYLFRHRGNGAVASLQLEDRAGLESENLDDEERGGSVSLKERLGTADGLVVLFDPMSDQTVLESRVSHSLDVLHVASGRGTIKDPRPIAVCVSKADLLIEQPEDLHRAINYPDEFVRERVSPVLVNVLNRYCTNYRLFPMSVAGVRLRLGIIEPVVFVDETLAPRICPGGMPFNLMQPFAWLLNQLTGAS